MVPGLDDRVINPQPFISLYQPKVHVTFPKQEIVFVLSRNWSSYRNTPLLDRASNAQVPESSSPVSLRENSIHLNRLGPGLFGVSIRPLTDEDMYLFVSLIP